MSELQYCRICQNKNLIDIINLGDHFLSSRFPPNINTPVPHSPLVLTKCVKSSSQSDPVCNLVQLKHTIDSSEMYLNEYGYRSGINNTMKSHINDLVKEIEDLYIIDGDTVLDIGSNDATLLKLYQNNTLNLVGIDPTGLQFKKYYTENISLVTDYFTKYNYLSTGRPKPKVITSLSMFYDLPDPLGFMMDVKDVLAFDGVWIMEQSYLPSMLESFSFDTICHEHLEYYSFQQILWMSEKVGLKVLDVSLNSCNGGSFRVTLTHKNSSYIPNSTRIDSIIEKEALLDINNLQVFTNFMSKCDKIKTQLTDFLQTQKKCGKTICIYGASTKGNTLLQYFGIDNKLITCIAEKNTDKWGKYTPGTLIPIVSEADVRTISPDFMLVLPWHFKEEFLTREKKYLDEGGQFIFPLPSVDVVSNKKKVLITGINGQIGTYLKHIIQRKDPDCLIYGTINTSTPEYKDAFYLNCDLVNPDSIEDIVDMLMKRDENHIYNLAGVTDANISVKDPILTLQLNTVLTTRICEKIVKTNPKIRLFQASSSEIFKGLATNDKVILVDDNTNFSPINPYGISKIASFHTIKYYRTSSDLFACSGLIFNTESPLRSSKFLSKKITSGVRDIRDKKQSHINVGNINAHRDWIHAYDTANAIYTILNHNKPDDYVISLSKLHSVKEFIDIAFKNIGVDLLWTPTGAIDRKTKIQLIKICESENRAYEKHNEMIKGNNKKLKSIGWKNVYELEDIINDMIDS